MMPGMAPASTEEQHQRGPAVSEVGEVVRTAGAERGIDVEPGLAEPGPGRDRERLVVDQRRLTLVDADCAMAAVRQAGVLDDFPDHLVQTWLVGLLEHSHRAPRKGVRRDDVRGLPGP